MPTSPCSTTFCFNPPASNYPFCVFLLCFNPLASSLPAFFFPSMLHTFASIPLLCAPIHSPSPGFPPPSLILPFCLLSVASFCPPGNRNDKDSYLQPHLSGACCCPHCLFTPQWPSTPVKRSSETACCVLQLRWLCPWMCTRSVTLV